MNIKPGTILSIALMGGIGYVIYKFYKGDWKLPNLFDWLPGQPDVTIKETGLPGATGDIIYNIAYPDLRERTHGAIPGARTETEDILIATTPPGEPLPDIPPEAIYSRAVAGTVSTDIVSKGGWSYLLPGLSAVTIGGGLAAMQRQEDWKQALPPLARERAEWLESKTRLEQVTGTPSGLGALALSIPVFTVPRIIEDIMRTSKPIPKTKIVRGPTYEQIIMNPLLTLKYKQHLPEE